MHRGWAGARAGGHRTQQPHVAHGLLHPLAISKAALGRDPTCASVSLLRLEVGCMTTGVKRRRWLSEKGTVEVKGGGGRAGTHVGHCFAHGGGCEEFSEAWRGGRQRNAGTNRAERERRGDA